MKTFKTTLSLYCCIAALFTLGQACGPPTTDCASYSVENCPATTCKVNTTTNKCGEPATGAFSVVACGSNKTKLTCLGNCTWDPDTKICRKSMAECLSFTTPNSCPDHCTWNESAGICDEAQSSCTSFLTPTTCPASCDWNDATGHCQDPILGCSSFDSPDTCKGPNCTWNATNKICSKTQAPSAQAAPCASMRADAFYQSIVDTPLSGWSKPTDYIRNGAITIIGNATAIDYSGLEDANLLKILKMDCNKIRTNSKYALASGLALPSCSANGSCDTERDAAITILIEVAGFDLAVLRGLQNYQLKGLMVGK